MIRSLIAFFAFEMLALTVSGQTSHYNFQRKLGPIDKEDWYGISIPEESFHRLNQSFDDLRIYRIEAADTVEIPYLLKIRRSEQTQTDFELPVLNKSSRNGKLYFTFHIQEKQSVNRIIIGLEEENYDALVTIEGSHDQKEWFTLASDKRILSIEDGMIDYVYNEVNFPASQYPYLRVSIWSADKITFRNAALKHIENNPGTLHSSPVTWNTVQKKETRQTIVDINLKQALPVTKVSLDITHDLDYYRYFIIEAVTDSMKSETGWKKFYTQVYSGYLSSLQSASFNFQNLTTKELRIIINNQDNIPLTINNVTVYYPQVELIAHLKPGAYTLMYGNERASAPQYDLVHFQSKIPENPEVIALGAEKNLAIPEPKIHPLLESKMWLWIILVVVIGILGYFTLKMLNTKKPDEVS